MNKKTFIITLCLLLFASAAFIHSRSLRENADTTAFHEAMPTSTPENIVGQIFVVGIPGRSVDPSTKKFLEEIRPGGIILYKLNIDSVPQLTKLISDLQHIAIATTGHKYLIMVDEEPGGASRLDLFQNVFATGEPDWSAIQSDVSKMKQIGINVDLAPVSDFPFNDDSFITRRMPAHTVADLISFNQRFISVLNDENMGSTLKHFPGMGVFVNDPHAGITYSNASTSVIDRSIDIFKHGIQDGADFVMTNHGVYDQLDPDLAASLSPKIVSILRQKLDFKGIIITDDLSDMPFIINKNISVPEAALETIRAGHTMVLFSRKEDTTLSAWKYIVDQYKEDPDIKKMIDASYSLVLNYKMIHQL